MNVDRGSRIGWQVRRRSAKRDCLPFGKGGLDHLYVEYESVVIQCTIRREREK